MTVKSRGSSPFTLSLPTTRLSMPSTVFSPAALSTVTACISMMSRWRSERLLQHYFLFTRFLNIFRLLLTLVLPLPTALLPTSLVRGFIASFHNMIMFKFSLTCSLKPYHLVNSGVASVRKLQKAGVKVGKIPKLVETILKNIAWRFNIISLTRSDLLRTLVEATPPLCSTSCVKQLSPPRWELIVLSFLWPNMLEFTVKVHYFNDKESLPLTYREALYLATRVSFCSFERKSLHWSDHPSRLELKPLVSLRSDTSQLAWSLMVLLWT